MMNSSLQNGLTLFTLGSVSIGTVGSGFIYLSLPVGIFLKVTSVALTVLGTYGCHSLWHSIPEELKREERNWTDHDLDNMVKEIRSQMTYKSIALNATMIGLITSCYLITLVGV